MEGRRKIVVIAPLLAPVDTKCGGRIHLILKALGDIGNEVEVISLVSSRDMNLLHTIDKVKYIFFSRIAHKKNHILKKIISKLRIYLSVFLFCFFTLNRKSVVVFFPNCDFRLLFLCICRIRGIRVVLEINEYPLVGAKNSFITRTKRFIIFRFSFPLFSGFIVISEELRQLVKSHSNCKALIIKIPVLANKPTLKIENRISPINFPYIIHAGSLIEQKDGVLGMLEAFSILTRKLDFPVMFVFTGYLQNSPDGDLIKNEIERYGLSERIVFTGYLTTEELETYLSFATAAIVNKNQNLQNKYCFATKLSEYLSWGIPVVTTNYGEAMNFLVSDLNSFIVPQMEYEIMAEILHRIFENPSEFKDIGQRGKELFNSKFEYTVYRRELGDFFTKII